MAPVLDAPPKWIGKAKAFQGVFIMLLTVLIGDSGFIDVGALSDFISGTLETGLLTAGGVWSILGTALRDKPVFLWKDPNPSG